MIDVHSRKGGRLDGRHPKTADLAEAQLAETIAAEKVPAGQLTIHSDNGTSMASKSVALLLADLGVVKSAPAPGSARLKWLTAPRKPEKRWSHVR